MSRKNGLLNRTFPLLFVGLLAACVLIAKPCFCLQKGIQSDHHIPTTVRQALSHLQNDDYHKAVPLLKAYLGTTKDTKQAWFNRSKFILAYSLMRKGKAKESILYWEDLARGTYILNDFCWFKNAEAMQKTGEIGKATLWFDQLPIMFPTSDFANQSLLLAAGLYFEQKSYQKVLSVLARIKSGYQAAKKLLLQAQSLSKLSRAHEEGAVLHELVTKWPLTSAARTAEKMLSKLILSSGLKKYELDLDERETRLRTFVQHRYYYQATKEARILIDKLPTSVRRDHIQFLLAKSLFHRRHYTEARKILVQLTSRISTGLKPSVLMYSGFIDFKRGNIKHAHHVLKTLARTYPDHHAPYRLGSYLGQKLLQEKEYKKALAMVECIPLSSVEQDERADYLWLKGWLYFVNGKYQTAGGWFQRIIDHHPRSVYKVKALFWTGKTNIALGKTKQARQAFNTVTQLFPNTFYAARSKTLQEHLPPDPEVIQNKKKRWQLAEIEHHFLSEYQMMLSTSRHGLRASELENMALYELAISELRRLPDTQATKDPVLWKIASLADKDRSYCQSTSLFRTLYDNFKAQHPDDLLSPSFLMKLYPMAYEKEISAQSKRFGINPCLIAAVILQESCYNPQARSSAGAIGLMQIMPKVGRWLAQRLKMRTYQTAWLNNPEINIKLGVCQLKWLKNLFHGDLISILAAYNAGRSKILRWQKKYTYRDPDVFVELMPYSETKYFVKRVIRNYFLYKSLYGNSQCKKTT